MPESPHLIRAGRLSLIAATICMVGAAAMAQPVVSGSGVATNAVTVPPTGPVGYAAMSRDPFEPINRVTFRLNEALDFGLLKPVARAYRQAVPSLVRTGVNNFFSNLYLPWSAVNNLLQGKPGNSGQDVLRFGINWYFGFAGVIDVGGGMGLESTYEDFGQTLAVWGVQPGPYVVLPFFGPSSLRDATSSLSLDWRADAVRTNKNIGVRNRSFVLRAVDARSQALRATEVIDDVAIDKYQFVRDAFFQFRDNQVYDGNPPLDPEDDPSRESVAPSGGVAAPPAANPASSNR